MANPFTCEKYGVPICQHGRCPVCDCCLECDSIWEGNVSGLQKGLKELRAAANLGGGYAYRNQYDFVLRHGVYCRGFFPAGYGQGAPKRCFANAILLGAKHNLRYVEGFALSPVSDIPVHHAWNLTANDRLVDSTWLNTGREYLGVEFSLERADEATWEGDASVLDDYRRGWPLFREPWRGEAHARTVSESERLRLLRSGKLREAWQLMEAECH